MYKYTSKTVYPLLLDLIHRFSCIYRELIILITINTSQTYFIFNQNAFIGLSIRI